MANRPKNTASPLPPRPSPSFPTPPMPRPPVSANFPRGPPGGGPFARPGLGPRPGGPGQGILPNPPAPAPFGSPSSSGARPPELPKNAPHPSRLANIPPPKTGLPPGPPPPHQTNGAHPPSFGGKRPDGPGGRDSFSAEPSKRPRENPIAPQTPQLIQLRQELTARAQKSSGPDVANLVVSAVVGLCGEQVSRFAPTFVESTFDSITRVLNISPNSFSQFKERVAAQLQKELTNFMEKNFQQELAMLLLATTSGPQQEVSLHSKTGAAIHNGTQESLLAMRNFLQRQDTEKRALEAPKPTHPAVPGQPQAPAHPQFGAQPTGYPQAAAPTGYPNYPDQSYQAHGTQPGLYPHAAAPAGYPQVPAPPAGFQAQLPQPGAASVPQALKPVSSNPQQEQALSNAALSGDLSVVSSLLQQGVNVNAAPQGGWTALMNATLHGHANVVSALLAAGADINLKDQSGFTALMYAASYLRPFIAEDLVRAGADVRAVDNAGRNIVHYAGDAQVRSAIDRGLAARGSHGLSVLFPQSTPAAPSQPSSAPIALVAPNQPQYQAPIATPPPSQYQSYVPQPHYNYGAPPAPQYQTTMLNR